MKCEIDAVYEGNVFRPITKVCDLPEHARFRLSVETAVETAGQTPAGQKPANASDDVTARAAEFELLAQLAFGNLTPDEEAALHAARLDQRHFFGHGDS